MRYAIYTAGLFLKLTLAYCSCFWESRHEEPGRSPNNWRLVKVKLSLTLGIVCIGFGLIFNEFILGRTIVPDGELTSVPLRIFIVICQTFLVGLGLYLLWKKPRIPVANIILVAQAYCSRLSSACYCLKSGPLLKLPLAYFSGHGSSRKALAP